jgi:hypothetical protein
LQSIKYLIEHHRVSVLDNRKITAGQIRSNKQLQYNNNISYLQVYCTIKALLVEIDSNKVDCFALFPGFIKHYRAVDKDNYTKLLLSPDYCFLAFFIVPAGYCRAGCKLRPIIAIDSMYILLYYRIILLIAVGIDTNNHVILLAWVLVPTKNER